MGVGGQGGKKAVTWEFTSESYLSGSSVDKDKARGKETREIIGAAQMKVSSSIGIRFRG